MVIETKPGAAGAVGAQVARPQPAATRCYRTSRRSPALPKSTAVRPSGEFTRADFIRSRASSRSCVLIVNDQAALQDAEGTDRRRQETAGEIIFSSSGLYGALHIPMRST